MFEPQAPQFDGTQPCADIDPDIFFPHPADKEGLQVAKDICNSCQFVDPCFAYAVKEPSLQGIWGATTQRQRESFRGRARRQASV